MDLNVEKLSVNRAGRRVLDNVSFQCAQSKAVMLRGPNGVGKTTLLRALAGILPHHSGTATIGETTLEDRDSFQALVTYAGHADAIKPQLSVAENIAFWANLYGTSSSEEALETFDLIPLMDRLAANCSAGQKRRLGLARILIAKRPLWLMDEPSVALDKASCERLGEVLRNHLASGGMAVIATHDDDLVDADTYHLTAVKQAHSDDPFLEAAF